MKQLFFLSLFLISFRMAGQLTPKQENAVDSLKSFINKAQLDTLKINAYTAWDNIIYISDPKLDQELNLKIVDLANENLKKESLNNSEKGFQKSIFFRFIIVLELFFTIKATKYNRNNIYNPHNSRL